MWSLPLQTRSERRTCRLLFCAAVAKVRCRQSRARANVGWLTHVPRSRTEDGTLQAPWLSERLVACGLWVAAMRPSAASDTFQEETLLFFVDVCSLLLLALPDGVDNEDGAHVNALVCALVQCFGDADSEREQQAVINGIANGFRGARMQRAHVDCEVAAFERNDSCMQKRFRGPSAPMLLAHSVPDCWRRCGRQSPPLSRFCSALPCRTLLQLLRTVCGAVLWYSF